MQKVVMVSLDPDLVDAIRGGIDLLGIFDRNDKIEGWLGTDDAWPQWSARNPDVFALLAVDVPAARRKLAPLYGAERWATFVSEAADISKRALIGRGSIVQRHCLVSSGAVIGEAVKLNVGAAVHHDCVVGSFSTLAPGCRLLGNVAVGAGCYVGTGAVVLPRRQIGAGATVGAGAVVTRDVPGGSTVVGVPAEQRRR